MDGEGRATLGAKAESNAGAVAEEQLPSLHRVNEDFKRRRPTTNGGGTVDIEQVLRDIHISLIVIE